MSTSRSPILASALLVATWLIAVAAAADEPAAKDAAQGAAGPPVCSDARAIEIAKLVQSRYDAISDLSADFEQTSQSAVLAGASLAEAESTRGKVVFAKPGKMRWAYLEPEPSFVVSDGQTIWIYDVGAAQASKLPVAGGYLAGAALQFLLGDGNLLEAFRISAVGCTEETVEMDLLPLQPASYERLGIEARASDGLIVETTIVDILGSRTRIAFEDVRFDVSPSEDTFEFEPPDGVEIIDLAAQ